MQTCVYKDYLMYHQHSLYCAGKFWLKRERDFDTAILTLKIFAVSDVWCTQTPQAGYINTYVLIYWHVLIPQAAADTTAASQKPLCSWSYFCKKPCIGTDLKVSEPLNFLLKLSQVTSIKEVWYASNSILIAA